MSEEQETHPGRIYNLRSLLITAMVHESTVVHEAHRQGVHQCEIEPYEQQEQFIADLISRFQPLDVESLTTQLGQVLTTLMVKVSSAKSTDIVEAVEEMLDIRDEALAEVLELIGMKGKDNE